MEFSTSVCAGKDEKLKVVGVVFPMVDPGD